MESDLNFEKLTLTSSEKSEYLNEKNKDEIKPKIWENPYRGMKIDNHTEILSKVNNRSKCVNCNKSRKFFCYTCYIPVDDLKGKLPKVKLPIKIDIVKHKHEIDGKATSTHAAILASEDVSMYNYPDIPDYSKEEGVVLIFPSPKSISISCIFTGNSDLQIKDNFGLPRGCHMGTFLKHKLKEIVKEGEDLGEEEDETDFQLYGSEIPIKKAVFIDSTWNQSRSIYKDPRINSLKCVILQNRISQFWRHQKGSPRWYLATIEAVHQFLLEVHINAWGVSSNYVKHLDQLQINTDFIPRCKIIKLEDGKEIPEEIIKPYEGQYDNLLFFFSHMYDLIHSHYDHELLRSYKRPFS